MTYHHPRCGSIIGKAMNDDLCGSTGLEGRTNDTAGCYEDALSRSRNKQQWLTKSRLSGHFSVSGRRYVGLCTCIQEEPRVDLITRLGQQVDRTVDGVEPG